MRQLCLLLILCASITAQGFEFCTPGPFPTAVSGTCAWYSKGGTATIQPDPAGALTGATANFPTEGLQWGIVRSTGATGAFAVGAGGPVPFPMTPGQAGNGTLDSTLLGPVPTPPASCDVLIRFDWKYVSPECPMDPSYNDFVTIDLVDPTSGVSLQNLLYRDTFSPSLAGGATTPDETGAVPVGWCAAPGTLEECLIGAPNGACVVVSPNLYGMIVDFEVNVGDGLDNAFNSYCYIDNVRYVVAQPGTPGMPITVLSQSGPAVGDLFITNYGLTPGAPAFNVFSFEPAPTGCGTGPLFGLFATNPIVLIDQVSIPGPPFQFIPTSCTNNTFALPAGAIMGGTCVEALCLQLGAAGPIFGDVTSFSGQ